MAEWTQVITAIVGGAIGATSALVGAYMNNKAADKRAGEQARVQQTTQRRELLLSRGEELHKQFGTWTVELSCSYLVSLQELEGRLSRDQANEARTDGSSTTPDLGRVQLLVAIYFPELKPELDAVIAKRDAANTHFSAWRDTAPNLGAFRQFRELAASCVEAAEAFQRSIVDAVRPILMDTTP